jgi:hypothetical protein
MFSIYNRLNSTPQVGNMIIGDLIALLLFLILAAFLIFPETRQLFETATTNFPALMAFIKFSILATAGELLARRLKSKTYSIKAFGLLPKAIIWGILGILISWAFIIFSTGIPKVFPFLEKMPPLPSRVLTAFLISLFMNLIFAPWMMLIHHLTDRFIAAHNGHFPFSKFNMLDLLNGIDWNRMWGFVFKKTIPLFWIPAHTITFLLPSNYRVLFAAVLSVFLGLMLGSVRKNEI